MQLFVQDYMANAKIISTCDGVQTSYLKIQVHIHDTVATFLTQW